MKPKNFEELDKLLNKLPIPITPAGGVFDITSWWNTGVARGYADYFKENWKKELLAKLPTRFKCGACDGAKCGHTLACVQMKEIVDEINSL